MSEHIEIEFKNLLTRNEFIKLTNYFSINKTDFFFQENYYFDTADFQLKKLESALRIRKKNDQYELTLKQPNDVGLLETNQVITEQEKKDLLKKRLFPTGEVAEKLIQMGIALDEIVYFGKLSTFRAEIPYCDGLLVFDKSYYFNKEDFELEYEVEHAEKGKEIFLNLLTQFQIPIRKTANKIQLFYHEKFGQGSE